MKRILFVDDEPRILEGLRRMLYPRRDRWEMVFAGSAKAALEALDSCNFDLIITDIRMPEMSGIELFGEVIKRHPDVIRFVLSGLADQEMTLHSVGLAHQYLVKPCDADLLRRTIERALSFRVLLDQPALKRLVSGINCLPSVPSCYGKLIHVLQNPHSNIWEIGAIVATDLAMSAKVLQLVNSAFFGLRCQIRNPMEAVAYLGVDTVKALVLTAGAFSRSERHNRRAVEELRQHSVWVGALAMRMAEALSLPKAAIDDSLTGGLLHDIGKLVLTAYCPERYDQVLALVRETGMRPFEAENIVFGATHESVGAYLLWLWGLPDPVIDAVAHHHQLPEAIDDPTLPATIVRYADELVHTLSEENCSKKPPQCCGEFDQWTQWQAVARELMSQEVPYVAKNPVC